MYAEQTTLNPIQLHLLEMFNHCDSEKMMLELKEVLAEFYAKQVQEEADRLSCDCKNNDFPHHLAENNSF